MEKIKEETIQSFEIIFIIKDMNGTEIPIDIPKELKAELSDRLFEELVE